MSRHPHQTVVIHQPDSTSGLAIAGLIFSILGWFTCGLLCVPGAFFCLLALFSRGPKGTAIAGLIVGFPGTLFFAFAGLGMIMGFLGLGAAATSAARDAAKNQSQVQDQAPFVPLSTDIPADESLLSGAMEYEETINGSAQTEAQTEAPAVSSLVASEPVVHPMQLPDKADEPRVRTWKSAVGGFTVEAEFISIEADVVTLKKLNGNTISIPLEKLSDDDKRWLLKTEMMQDFGRSR